MCDKKLRKDYGSQAKFPIGSNKVFTKRRETCHGTRFSRRVFDILIRVVNLRLQPLLNPIISLLLSQDYITFSIPFPICFLLFPYP